VSDGLVDQIREIVDRETRAWDTRDVELLLSIFHPDFVWVWPSAEDAHDPAGWKIGLGRFDPDRWRSVYQELFDSHELVHNRRQTVKLEVAAEGDGAFAVVDIDTLWRNRATGEDQLWQGRVCKVYSLVDGEWKLTMHTGALLYPADAAVPARAWVEAWSRAWPAKDPEPVASLYADDAVFTSQAFREPLRGPAGVREYMEWAFAEQADVEFAFAEPVVAGDRAAVEWWAAITAPDGGVETIQGASLLCFAPDGRVLEDQAYWGSVAGRGARPEWAG
jgi:uncharacterized protein (TIGR02246 family)